MKAPEGFSHKSWWEASHASMDEWVGGLDPKTVLKWHGHSEESLVGLRVMDLGVGGSAAMARHLSRLGARVISVDISEAALAKALKAGAHEAALTGDLSGLPQVHVCICNLVFQHCDDDEVLRIINDVRLFPYGCMTFQIATAKGGGDRRIPPNEPWKLILRSDEQVMDLVNRTSKRVIESKYIDTFEETDGIGWWIFRVRP